MNNQQQLIDDQVKEWAKSDVGTLSSFANMECLLKREYHGRFIIELIQNARDAWYALDKNPEVKSVVRIILHGDTDHPVLTVCNQGLNFNAERLLKHITQFGESSKISGEGIGHKGIGFKSVLEITRTPEIYSREIPDENFTLRVRFDPRESETLLDQNHGKSWEQLVREYDKVGSKSKEQRLPVLRFPHWIENISQHVHEEAKWNNIQFNTLIRLPYDSAFDTILDIDKDRWLKTVRTAIDGVTDEIVMLIDAFEKVVIEDKLKGEETLIVSKPVVFDKIDDVIYRRIEITRNDVESSNWMLYKKIIDKADITRLSQEIIVGVKYENSDDLLIPCDPNEQARCFHLFFPTRIDSKLPFLFHAYFEVDAGRTRFAPDAIQTNSRLLDELEELFIYVIKDLIKRDEQNEFLISELPALFQITDGTPDDLQAKNFKDNLLNRLDSHPWVAVEHVAKRRTGKPAELLIHKNSEISLWMKEIFRPSYAWEMAQILIPNHTVINGNGIGFIAGRLGDNAFSLEIFEKLLRPGPTPIWIDNENDRFVNLLELINKLQALIGQQFIDFIEKLRGLDDSQIIPTSTKNGVNFIPLPSMRVQGKLDLAVFARLSMPKSGISLMPPKCLNIAFMDDGIMNKDLLSGPGQLLGIKDYSVNSILDRLKTENTYQDKENEMILNFVWQLLLKEDVSTYGVKSVVEKLSTFSPGTWWWYQKDRGRTDPEMADQRRAKGLNNIKLPAKSGLWVTAESLVFGKKWAERMDSLKKNYESVAFSIRVASFYDLEDLAPDDDSIVADPDILSSILTVPRLIDWQDSDSVFLPNDEIEKQLILMFCFLQRLGVWEIMPVKAIVDYTIGRKDQWECVVSRGPHRKFVSDENCDFNKYNHQNIYVEKDFDWAWQITQNGSKRFLDSLSRGCQFYSRITHMTLFCSSCKGHRQKKYNSTDDFQPSLLLWRLMNEKWLHCDIGDSTNEIYSPAEVWWESNIPERTHIRTSPLRFLPIVRDMDSDTARLCRLKILSEVDITDIEKILIRLRNDYESQNLFNYISKDSSFRQAFIGLHQRLYSRLRKIGNVASAKECISQVGLLCEIGGLLKWQSPENSMYDNGKFAIYKLQFISDVHFCVLSRGDEDSAVAKFLDIREFTVTVTRSDNDKAKDVTSEFSILNDRLAHLFSLLVFYRIGTSPLNIGSKAFSHRLEQIKNLRIYKVDDLYLTLSVDETISKTIGKGDSGNMYLDKTDQSHPKIYHDYNETELLRPKIAPYISELIENHAYSDAISLLYQCPDSDLPYFLNERGITENQMTDIRAAIGQNDIILQRQARVWWSAVLELLSIPHNRLPQEDIFQEVSTHIQNSGLPGDFKLKLLNHTDVDRAREDPKGILLDIETAGYSLSDLHAILLRNNDQGISIHVAKQKFLDWLSKYEKELSYTLYRLGIKADQAKNFSRNWVLPKDLCFRIQIELSQVLERFASGLNELCNSPDKQFNAQSLSDNALPHLSTLCYESPAELSANSKLFYSDEERNRIHRNNFAEIKHRIALYITVIKTIPATPSFKIREIHQSVLDMIALVVNAPSLSKMVNLLCGKYLTPQKLELFDDYIGKLFPDNHQLLELPGKEDMQKFIGTIIDLSTLSGIQKVLSEKNRENVDQIRKKIVELNQNLIVLKPYQGSCAKLTTASVATIKNVKPCHVTPKNQRLLKKMGSDAEQWVLAAQTAQLEKLCKESVHKFCSCLDDMADALKRYYEGPSVDKLISCKERALLNNLHDDERIEALSDFMHLSKESDQFGCDILGWLTPFEGVEAKPLFLEVKSDIDRKFNVSENEWKQAERLEDNYAFMVVLRGNLNTPQCFELLPYPYHLSNDSVGGLMVVPDGRVVSYSIKSAQ